MPGDPGRPEAEADRRDRRPVGSLQPSGPFSVRNDPPNHSVVCDDPCESLRGVPGHVRSDNGPEFIAKAVREWIAAVGARTAFIEPGSPWENGYRESFKAKLRDELLNGGAVL
jgi:transposase InsO family protein